MRLLFSASRLLTVSLFYSVARKLVKPRTRIKNLLCMKSNRSRSHPEDRLQATSARSGALVSGRSKERTLVFAHPDRGYARNRDHNERRFWRGASE